MTRIQVAHTAHLSPADLSASRALLYEAFDDMAESDWRQALGGMHALAWDGDVLVGHASLVQRQLLGWLRWRGPTSALTTGGVVRTPEEDGYIFVLPVTAPLHPDGELICDWREGNAW